VNGSDVEIVEVFPFVLSLSKHERYSLGTFHLGNLYIFRTARVVRRDWATVGKKSIAERGKGPDQEFTALRSPDDLLVVAAGGPAGGFGAVIPPWLGTWSHAVTRAVMKD